MPKVKKNIIPIVEPAPKQEEPTEPILDEEDTEIQPESDKRLVDSKEVFTGRKGNKVPEPSIEEPKDIEQPPPSKTGKNGRSKKPLTEKQQQHLDFMREKAQATREAKRLEREEAKKKREEAKALKQKLKEEKRLLEEKRKQEEELEILKEQQEIEMLQQEISRLKPKNMEQVKQIEEHTNAVVEKPSYGEAGSVRAEPLNHKPIKEENGTLDIEALIAKGIQGYEKIRKERKQQKQQQNIISEKEKRESDMIKRQISQISKKPYDPYSHCFNFS
jgi:phage-related minor tail protein